MASIDAQCAALTWYRQTHAATLAALGEEIARLQARFNDMVVMGSIEIAEREDAIVQMLVYEDARLAEARVTALWEAGILSKRPYDSHVFRPKDVAACLDPSVRPLWERTSDVDHPASA